ncbi:uncharacterized protein BXZ73DRAFT_77372 [Epithele typhae]|uniref:uncharacterized protein n=1 Tax=Epithele typhae TaxID=378194 RepID=UPI002008640A|nr:uncharacterized protein BXZ73DRAFT_77372 [Epithele typhae]KAH9933214.1 hypothetical protein BXZ73DRAFT_77372 [Epithele typhae]
MTAPDSPSYVVRARLALGFGFFLMLTAIIGSLVQLFFAWRVKVLTNNTLAVVVIVACSITQLRTSIATRMMPEFVEFRRFKIIVFFWLIASAVADCLITFVLVGYLRRHKTGFGPTDDFVNKTIRLTAQTGLITAVWAIVDLVVFLASPTGVHLIFNLSLSKLYTNSLMSSLNSRSGWKYGSNSSGPITGSNFSNRRNGEGSQITPSQVYIDVESHEMVDGADAKGVYPPEPALCPHDYTKSSQSYYASCFVLFLIVALVRLLQREYDRSRLRLPVQALT